MSKDRRQYSQEFKREAVRLMTEGGVPLAQVSRDLGVCTSVLGKWKRALLDSASPTVSSATGSTPSSKVKAFPGHGVARDEELARLRRELEIAQQERDILKKAVGIFSQVRR
jgi:transposase